MNNKITVAAMLNADVKKVWEYYTNPVHIINWNFADDSWHCPKATNDMKVGGKYNARMEAKNGTAGFDFEAIYEQINPGKNFIYSMGGRSVKVSMEPTMNQTEVVIVFDAEKENSLELQKTGWQMILNNFKKYTENN